MRASLRLVACFCSVTFLACSADRFTPAASGGAGGQGAFGGLPGGSAGAAGASGVGGGTAGSAGVGGGSAGSAGVGGGSAGSAGVGGGGGQGAAAGAGKGGASSGGTAGAAGVGGAGAGGASGTSGSGGQGGAGGATTACLEARPPVKVTWFEQACPTPFTACLVPGAAGTRAHVTATTCGVAVARASQPTVIGVTFPERSDIAPLALPGADAPHGITMRGPRLFVGSSGDSLLGVPSFGPGIEPEAFHFAPQGTAPLQDALSYHSVIATDEVIAWTGRQGFEITLLSPEKLGCTELPTAGGCTEQRSANTDASPPSPGWGVTSIGKTVYWSSPLGVHSTTLGKSDAPIDTTPSPGTLPGPLVTIGGHIVQAREATLLVYPPKLGGPGAPPAFATNHGPIRDMVAYDGDTLFIVTKGKGNGLLTTSTVNITSGPIKLVIAEMPSNTEPLSITAGPTAAYVGMADGTVYRFPFAKPSN